MWTHSSLLPQVDLGDISRVKLWKFLGLFVEISPTQLLFRNYTNEKPVPLILYTHPIDPIDRAVFRINRYAGTTALVLWTFVHGMEKCGSLSFSWAYEVCVRVWTTCSPIQFTYEVQFTSYHPNYLLYIYRYSNYMAVMEVINVRLRYINKLTVKYKNVL